MARLGQVVELQSGLGLADSRVAWKHWAERGSYETENAVLLGCHVGGTKRSCLFGAFVNPSRSTARQTTTRCRTAATHGYDNSDRGTQSEEWWTLPVTLES